MKTTDLQKQSAVRAAWIQLKRLTGIIPPVQTVQTSRPNVNVTDGDRRSENETSEFNKSSENLPESECFECKIKKKNSGWSNLICSHLNVVTLSWRQIFIWWTEETNDTFTVHEQSDALNNKRTFNPSTYLKNSKSPRLEMFGFHHAETWDKNKHFDYDSYSFTNSDLCSENLWFSAKVWNFELF